MSLSYQFGGHVLYGDFMKKIYRKTIGILLPLTLSLMLGGCGGYARTPNGSSSVEAYGVIDVGVQHGNP